MAAGRVSRGPLGSKRTGETLEVILFPRPRELVRRMPRLLVGITLLGAGVALMLRAKLGLSPWDVLHQGLADHLGLSVGVVIIGLGVLILLTWIPLHQGFGVGTIINTLVVGLIVNGVFDVLAAPHGLWLRSALMVAGVLCVGVGTGCYIAAGLGPGPRDGVMTAIAARGYPLWAVRTVMEAAALVGGLALGGNVGVGTLLFAVGIGPLADVFLRLFRLPPLPESERGIGVTGE
ncbi:MAG: integral rane protein [Actinomycetia bacterium]|nr:integral rane protein [Actinomycetes bacterium]